mmetsp:Transcript_39476/g.83019  ORF Transcript_39476/g.83019 Transcript_39476/m.83019 type:complete len:306 (+) Transcript_39476:690-1607(+)
MALASVHVQHFSITNAHLPYRIAPSQAVRIKGFIPLHIRHGGDNPSTSRLGQTFEILAIAPPRANNSSFDEVLHAQIVHALGGEDDTRSGIDNLPNAFLGDVHFALFDIFNLSGILDDDLDAHSHAMPLQVHIQHGNFDGLAIGRFDEGGHALRGAHGVDGKSAIDEVGFHGRFSVSFENVNGGEGIFESLFLPGGGWCWQCIVVASAAAATHGIVAGHICGGGIHLDAFDGIDGQFGEEIRFGANDFGGHGRLGSIDEMFVSQFRHVDDHFLLDVGDGRLQCRSISRNDGGRVNATLNEVIATT